MKKWVERIAALSFGLGIGFGIIRGYVTMGTILFVIAGGLWLYANIAFEAFEESEEPEGEETQSKGG